MKKSDSIAKSIHELTEEEIQLFAASEVPENTKLTMEYKDWLNK